VLVLAAVLLPGLDRAPRIPDGAVLVELVGSLRPANPPSKARPAAPAPSSAPQRVETRKPEPVAPKKPRPAPKPAPSKSTAPPAEPAAPAPAPATPPAAEPPLDPGGASIVAADTGGSELAWYRAAVTAALHVHWRRPLLEGTREPYEVAVEFEIRRDGSLGDVRIARESGVPSLDRSAVRAVADAAPLPPLPPAWEGAVLTVACVFRYLPE